MTRYQRCRPQVHKKGRLVLRFHFPITLKIGSFAPVTEKTTNLSFASPLSVWWTFLHMLHLPQTLTCLSFKLLNAEIGALHPKDGSAPKQSRSANILTDARMKPRFTLQICRHNCHMRKLLQLPKHAYSILKYSINILCVVHPIMSHSKHNTYCSCFVVIFKPSNYLVHACHGRS